MRTQTDVSAAIHLRGYLSHSLDDVVDLERFNPDDVDALTVTFERKVNEQGVPVRRVVATGAWECDPLARAKQPERTAAP